MAFTRLQQEIGTLSASSYGGIDVDWLEDDDAHIFKFNVPGMKTEDVKVRMVGGDMLEVSGVRKDVEKIYGGGGIWRIKERPTGSFFRKFQLPSGDVKTDEVIAYDENGVLVVTVPKRKRYIRTIPISML